MPKYRLFYYSVILIFGLLTGLVAHLSIGQPIYFESIMSLLITGFLVERFA